MKIIATFIKTLNFILNHPLNKSRKVKALLHFAKWQVSTFLNTYPIIYPFAEKSKLIMWKGLHGATGNLYCGLDEFEDMAFVLHFLRKDDIFIDIGANIGSYTILAASEVGAETISIEPIPSTFNILTTNLKLNNLENKVRSINVGLGSEEGILKFTKSLDTVNHVATSVETETLDIKVEILDDIIIITKPTLIKIDVEGYETEVLKGMENVLNSPHLKAIIIEMNGSGKSYGFDEGLIHDSLLSHNFMWIDYAPFDRLLNDSPYRIRGNRIYIRDSEFVYNRIKNSKVFMIHGIPI